MAEAVQWDQSRFDSTIKECLLTYESRDWPRVCNKHAFFVALRAQGEVERVTPGQIDSELGRKVLAKRKDGSSDLVDVGYTLISKRASKHYLSSARFARQAGRDLAKDLGGRGAGGNYREAWLRNLKDEQRSLYGGRKASVQFLRAGFVSITYGLASHSGLSRPGPGVSRVDTKIRGAVKGSVLHIASPGDYSVTIENRAHSQHEHRGGFERIGGAALQIAFDKEAASMAEHMEEEMKPAAEKFNRNNR